VSSPAAGAEAGAAAATAADPKKAEEAAKAGAKMDESKPTTNVQVRTKNGYF